MTLVPAIAAELRALAAATEELAATLCSDEHLAARCVPLLQQFDLLAQTQAELADLLVRLGGDEREALGAVRLSALAERLAKAA